MIDALRNAAYRSRVIADRLRQGVDPYRPIGHAPTLQAPGEMKPGQVADPVPVADFLTGTEREKALLEAHSTEISAELTWAMRHLLDATRPDSLLDNDMHVVSGDALILHEFSIAMAPPDTWQPVPLAGLSFEVHGGRNVFCSVPDQLPAVGTSDPIGLLSSEEGFRIELRLPSPADVSFLFLPLTSVPEADLVVGGHRIPGMATARGLFFWLGETDVESFSIEVKAGGSYLLGMPVAVFGSWTRPGTLILSAGEQPPVVFLQAVNAGATLSLSVGNIQNWLDVEAGSLVALPVPIKRMVAMPTGGLTIALPTDMVPRRVYAGHRSWLQERQSLSGGTWSTASSGFVPLEATAQLSASASERIRLRTYLTASRTHAISVNIPGQVYVNGALQLAGRLEIPEGESELVVQLGTGTHTFYLPLPSDISSRARYAPLRWTIDGSVLTLAEVTTAPCEVLLYEASRPDVYVKAIFPVDQDRPSIMADLQLNQ